MVTFRGSDVTVTLAMLAPDLVRVRMARSGTSFPDGLSVLAKTSWPAPSFDFRRAPNGVLIRTSENDLEEINRKSIELRYRLLPYLYNVFYEASRTGLPVMRALLLDFPDDVAAVDQPHEFLWGNDLLVAPVTKDDEKTWPVYLPRGVWFDFWTDRRYTGPARIVVGAPLDRVPVFVRGGAIIPAQEVVQFVDQAPLDPLILEIYPAGASSREYYEDDGISFAYQRGVWLRQRFSVEEHEDSLGVRVSAREGSYIPPRRSLALKIHCVSRRPRRVEVDGQSLDPVPAGEETRSVSEGWNYDTEARVLWINTAYRGAALEVRIDR